VSSQHSAVSTQQSALSTQQSALSSQHSAFSRWHLAVGTHFLSVILSVARSHSDRTESKDPYIQHESCTRNASIATRFTSWGALPARCTSGAQVTFTFASGR